ncbi:MAG: hypothetical protein FLDDKLPJ_00986 [Phycisphaerae bacterium]|nr:hypothetical protein [Phycisphaerae bacterium]
MQLRNARAVILGLAAFGLTSAATFAQEGRPDYQNVNNNASAGRVAERSPGRLVSTGLSRARTFINRSREGTQIDQDASSVPLSPWAAARIEALQIMFTNLNLMINAFHNTIRAQAGLDPVPPVLPDFPDVGGGDGGGGLPDFGGIDLDDFLDDFLNN